MYKHSRRRGDGDLARAVYEDWQLAHSLGEFRRWLAHGAPSDDVFDPKDK